MVEGSGLMRLYFHHHSSGTSGRICRNPGEKAFGAFEPVAIPDCAKPELEGSIQGGAGRRSKTNPQKLTSRTRSNRIVIFSGGKDLIGRLINVKITEAKTFSLFGEIF